MLSDHLHDCLCQTISGLCAWTGLPDKDPFFLSYLISLVPPSHHIPLIGIDEAGSSSSTFGFGKGAVGQPSVNRSPGDSNPRSDINRWKPLVMKFNDLRVSIQLLSASSDASLFLAPR